MEYFFETSGTIPKGVGFKHFDTCHLLWLLGFVAVTALCCLLYKKLNEKNRAVMRYVIAALIVGDELFKIAGLAAFGNYSLDYLPLHLCSINIVLIAIHAAKPCRTLNSFLYTVCIPGAVVALLFPTWTKLPAANFMHIHSFTVHILLALYPIVLTVNGDIKINARDIPRCLALLSAFAVFAIGMNACLDTNFMFFADVSKGNPLYWFEKAFGNHLFGYPILVATVLFLMYAPVSAFRTCRNHFQNKHS